MAVRASLEAFLVELVERGYGTVPTEDPAVAAPATREGSRDALPVAFRPCDRARPTALTGAGKRAIKKICGEPSPQAPRFRVAGAD